MDFKPTNQTEVIINLALQSFEGQIRILHSLGYHSDRKQHIENLRRMVLALSQAIDKNKEIILAGIEDTANASANEIVAIRTFLNNLAKHSGDPYAEECAREINQVEKPAINRIGLAEAQIENTVIKRTKMLQEIISSLLTQIDALRQ